MRNVSVNWVSDLIDVRVRSLNFQVVSEVKVRVKKHRAIRLFDFVFNNHWIRPGLAKVIEIFCGLYNKETNQ